MSFSKPKLPAKCTTYSHRYRSSWETQPEFKGWLAAVAGDNLQGFCKVCKTSLRARRKDLLDHANTKKHKRNVNIGGSATQTVQTFLKVPVSTELKIAELKLAAHVAEHSAFCSSDHLGELVQSLIPESADCRHLKQIKLHRTKCAGLIREVLAPVFLKEVISDIGESFYSLIIDESNDVSNIKCLGIVVRYYSETKKRVIDTMYRLVPLGGADAGTVSNTVLACLSEDGLSINKLIGIGVDGASTMVGVHHSVSTILREKVGEHFTVVRCVCHSLHLAASKASLLMPRHLDFLVRETCNWFSHSDKRKRQYELLYNTITGENPLKLSTMSGTRWLAQRAIIGKILVQWNELQFLFKVAKDEERCYTAEQLYLMYTDKVNKLYLNFLFNTLDNVCKVNTIFQSGQPNQVKMLDDLVLLYIGLLKQLVLPAHMKEVKRDNTLFNFEFKKYVMHTAGMNFGYEFNILANELQREVVDGVRERCKEFLVELAEQVRIRLPANLKILMMLDRFSPESALAPFKKDIEDIAAFFKCIIEGEVDKCQKQWDMLNSIKDLCDYVKKSPKDIIGFWSLVSRQQDACGDQRFGVISKLVLALLSIPLSNASVERLFSQMSVVKTKLRNRMLVESSQAVLLVRYGLALRGQNCSTFVPSQAMLSTFRSEFVYKNLASSSTAQADSGSATDEMEEEEDVATVFNL